jgi:hypothetical protein
MKTYSPLPEGWRISGDYLITPDVAYGCHKDCERFIHGEGLAARCAFVANTLEGYGFKEYATGWTELGRMKAQWEVVKTVLGGVSAEDLHATTGAPLSECRELYAALSA